MSFFGELAEFLKIVSPKDKLWKKYLDIVKLSMEITIAEMDDLTTYMKTHGLKITPEFIIKKQESLLHKHIENQINLTAKTS